MVLAIFHHRRLEDLILRVLPHPTFDHDAHHLDEKALRVQDPERGINLRDRISSKNYRCNKSFRVDSNLGLDPEGRERVATGHRPRRVDRHKHACIGQVRNLSRWHDGSRQYETRRASTTGQGRIECNGGAEQLCAKFHT